MKILKKILISGAAFIDALLISASSAFAADHTMKVAFLGDTNLKSTTVRKIFGNSNISQDGKDIWGIRVVSPDDTVLYRFRDEVASDINALRGCNIIFMIVDLSTVTASDLDHILKNGVFNIRTKSSESKIVLVATNIDLSFEKSKTDYSKTIKLIDDARGFYSENEFNFILTSSNENDETLRNKFFEVSDKMVNWKELQSPIKNNLPMTVKHDIEIAELKKENDELKRRIDMHDIKINEIEETTKESGVESWAIVEQIVNSLLRDGKIDRKGCKEIIDSINKIKSEYVDVKTAVNSGLNGFEKTISDFRKELTKHENASADFTKKICTMLDKMTLRIDNVKSEMNSAISVQDIHIRDIDTQKSDQIKDLSDQIVKMKAVFEAVSKLDKEFMEFMDDTNRKLSVLPTDLQTKIKKELQANYENLNWFRKAAGWAIGIGEVIK